MCYVVVNNDYNFQIKIKQNLTLIIQIECRTVDENVSMTKFSLVSPRDSFQSEITSDLSFSQELVFSNVYV